ncbi:hypothetical protein NKI46_20255 [Mesorhizobium sp. M0615]|uniref:hypothetical protein n=1 Tax=Mesorhizobium sp. M0615 TaxID=2956971 RepID=UPI003339F325
MTDRRTVLMAAGVAAVAAATGAAAAQSPDIRAPDIRATDIRATDIRGAVTFVGGKAIPEGHLEIYLEDPAIHDSGRRRAAKTSLKSEGGSKTIEFSLPLPASSTASPTLQVVARLERADGWLVARGSAQFQAGLPVHVTLKAVIY